MKEQVVENKIREYLKVKGWKLTNLPKLIGQHGCDITAWHPKNRKILLIEAKGSENTKMKNQIIHQSFYVLLGQILSRMDREGNSYNKARIYAIAIPLSWAKVYVKKIEKMLYGWNMLKLKVFLVSDDSVEEYSYKKFVTNYGKKIFK